jgi:hypothetical protein
VLELERLVITKQKQMNDDMAAAIAELEALWAKYGPWGAAGQAEKIDARKRAGQEANQLAVQTLRASVAAGRRRLVG